MIIMSYDGKLLARAREQLDTIRINNQAEHRRRIGLIYSRLPEVQSLDMQLRATMAQLVRLTVSRPADLKLQLERLEKTNLELQARKAELLVENGYPMDYLDDIYSCKKCRDTGLFNSRPCSCLEKLYNSEMTRELGTLMRRGDESFENFDLRLYSDAYDFSVESSPREIMKLSWAACRDYAEGFSEGSGNLLLRGGTGLGKTYLSACIARVVAEKGFSVCYDSVSAALEAFEIQKFSRDPEQSEAASLRVKRMLDCDLMILDDLGTEMVTPMSVSALYTLINTRLVNGKKLIISTNLSDTELAGRYSAQIYSRIKGEFRLIPFYGQDIRLTVKGK